MKEVKLALFFIISISGLVFAIDSYSKSIVGNEITAKEHVKVSSLNPELYAAIGIAYITKKEIAKKGLTITSGNDSKHIKGSKHFKDKAIDIRIKDIPIRKRKVYFQRLKKRLGINYEVIYYKDHIHIELAN